MEDALKEIIAAIYRSDRELDEAWLDDLVRRHNRERHDTARHVAKKRLLPYYFDVKENDPVRWESWGVDEACEERLVRLLRVKPRRTASGVATITVLTKPWPCSSDCLYCPCDVRMPKSYLAHEPACQRAELTFFDPYLQVMARLHTLEVMGHVTDKVELIILGGTWSDYPESYQVWFVHELFRALNDAGTIGSREDNETARREVREREEAYRACGILSAPDDLAQNAACLQQAVNEGAQTYNEAVGAFYRTGGWERAASFQQADMDALVREQQINEDAPRRVVGLVIETRPDLITAQSLTLMRRLGCTKVQMGIQSLDAKLLALNERNVTIDEIKRAFALLRLFGFKTHVHFMVNLLGATPTSDKADYLTLINDEAYRPDEVKLYPCALVESSRLRQCYEQGTWRPYTEGELLDVLVSDVLATPPYTRISRMIRDISADDIVAGNKKTNLRQLVEERVATSDAPIREIRLREISTDEVYADELSLEVVRYDTTVSEECFLQWVTPEGKIAGFLRLSLPHFDEARTLYEDDVAALPTAPTEAMIREVHVYGKVARLHEADAGAAQHTGLGRRLVKEAADLARATGYDAINVISSVGTRNYYRKLGFHDAGLYQKMALAPSV